VWGARGEETRRARLSSEPLGYLWVVVVTMRMIDSLLPLSWFALHFFLLSVLYVWMLLREVFIPCLSSLRYASAASGHFFSRIFVRLQATGERNSSRYRLPAAEIYFR
jgi:hypothetical protein